MPEADTTNVANAASPDSQSLQLRHRVLDQLKSAFVGKDEIIDLLGVCLVAGENLFLLGPPGTAKSALVQFLAKRIDGQFFDYLLTRFTEPNELFGPFDIRRLREGELVTNFQGMLPEADFVFLDELLNANSAILNSLLMALNERVFRRGRESVAINSLMFVGASNHLPEDDALGALFDRFLVRVECNNVETEKLGAVLQAGWQLQSQQEIENTYSVDEIRKLQSMLINVDMTAVQEPLIELVSRLRDAGIDISDRRAVKLQRLLAASAVLCGRNKCITSDIWIARYIWNTLEQSQVIRPVVDEIIDKSEAEPSSDHPRSREHQPPNAEHIATQLKTLESLVLDSPESATKVKDQLTLLSAQIQWLQNEVAREQLSEHVDKIWKQVNGNE